MWKMVSAIAGAAIIAAAISLFPGFSPEVEASTPDLAAANLATKAPAPESRPSGAGCSQQAWPYFEAACLNNRGAAQLRQVRIISVR